MDQAYDINHWTVGDERLSKIIPNIDTYINKGYLITIATRKDLIHGIIASRKRGNVAQLQILYTSDDNKPLESILISLKHYKCTMYGFTSNIEECYLYARLGAWEAPKSMYIISEEDHVYNQASYTCYEFRHY